MATGVQNIETINAFDPLILDDLSVSGASIDPEQLTATYPLDPAWIGISHLTGQSYYSIVGATIEVQDTDPADWIPGPAVLPFPNGMPADKTTNRYYYNVLVQFVGGNTSPIQLRTSLKWGTAQLTLSQTSMVNGATTTIYQMGGVFVPAGADFIVSNVTHGSVNDDMYVSMFGFQAKPGIPIPMPPGRPAWTSNLP